MAANYYILLGDIILPRNIAHREEFQRRLQHACENQRGRPRKVALASDHDHPNCRAQGQGMNRCANNLKLWEEYMKRSLVLSTMIITLLMVSVCVGEGFYLGKMESTANEPSLNTSVEIPAENKPNDIIDINKVILGNEHRTIELKKQLDEINQQFKDALYDDATKRIETDYLKNNTDKLSRPLPLQPYVPRISPTPGGIITFTPNYPHY